MSENNDPFEIDFDGEKRKFRDFDELEAWFAEENTIWSEFAKSVNQNNAPLIGRDKQKQSVNQFRQQIGQIKSSNDPQDRKTRKERLIRDIEKASKQSKDKFIPSFSPKGQHVLNLAEKADQIELALGVLAYFVGQPIPQQNITSIVVSGLLEGAMFDKGTTKSVESERRALKKLRSDWDAKFSEDDSRNSETLADAEKVKAELLAFQSQEKATYDEALNSAKERIAELEELFFKKIQVDASKSYWAKRAFTSRLSFSLWMILLVFFGGAFAKLFTEFVDQAVTSSTTGEAAILEYGSLLVFAIIGIGGFRLIAKMMVSALHVNHEASERVTMIQTYLALLAEDSAVSEDERNLILPTLFRPGSTGLLSEDPKAELPMETALRLLAKRPQ